MRRNYEPSFYVSLSWIEYGQERIKKWQRVGGKKERTGEKV